MPSLDIALSATPTNIGIYGGGIGRAAGLRVRLIPYTGVKCTHGGTATIPPPPYPAAVGRRREGVGGESSGPCTLRRSRPWGLTIVRKLRSGDPAAPAGDRL